MNNMEDKINSLKSKVFKSYEILYCTNDNDNKQYEIDANQQCTKDYDQQKVNVELQIAELESRIAKLYELYQEYGELKHHKSQLRVELQTAELELEKAKILYENNNEYQELSDDYNKKDYIAYHAHWPKTIILYRSLHKILNKSISLFKIGPMLYQEYKLEDARNAQPDTPQVISARRLRGFTGGIPLP